MLAADYAPAMFDGAEVRAFAGIGARGSPFLTLAGREAVGLDRAGKPRPLGAGRFAVAALPPYGAIRTALPAYVESEGAASLEHRPYAAAAADANGDLYVAALPLDPDASESRAATDDLGARLAAGLGALPGNRLARQLARCARDYGCRAAANAFRGLGDCSLPLAAPSNERPPAPLSIRAEADAAPTEPAAFHPTADEIAAVALRHFEHGGTAVSFGGACDGEPLLAVRVLEAAVERIRARNATGVIQLETNGSSALALRRAIGAGVDSVAVRIASARADTYERLHGPQAYRFTDVRASIEAASASGVSLALVILVLPGLTDRPSELAAIVDLAGSLPSGGQLVLRDLACDPSGTLALLQGAGSPIGIMSAIERLRADAPHLRVGALVRPPARV